MLILFDCWINVYLKLPFILIIYMLGARAIRFKWFPKIIADSYFKVVKHSKLRKIRAYRFFDRLLYDSVLLCLELQENIHFKRNDNDEIKSRNYHKEHLGIMGYSNKYSDLDSKCMDKWNMHTLSNQVISVNKIKICEVNNSPILKHVFLYSINNTSLDIKNICPILYDYLLDRGYLK